MTVTAKNRVMIFGPKADGTYVLSSRRQRGRRWRSQSPGQRQRCSNNADRPAARVAIHLCVLSERPNRHPTLGRLNAKVCACRLPPVQREHFYRWAAQEKTLAH